MMKISLLAYAGILALLPLTAQSTPQWRSEIFEELVARCAPDIHPQTLRGIVTTESMFNPFAIGVVGGHVNSPRTHAEAISTAKQLEKSGFNFSLGLAQVNRYNLEKYNETYETIFEPCRNMRAGAAILKDCFIKAKSMVEDEQQALRAAFSCYYSGNFTRGFKPDKPGKYSYVQKVVFNALDSKDGVIIPAVKQQSKDTVSAHIAERKSTPKAIKDRVPVPNWYGFGNTQKSTSDNQQEVVPVITQSKPAQQTELPVRDATKSDQNNSFVTIIDSKIHREE